MKPHVEFDPDIAEIMREEELGSRRAVSRAMRAAGDGLKADWRGQITGAGLGTRLARTVRSRVYPERAESNAAAAMVWSRAPRVVRAFEEGATIRSKDGFFLAIPTEAAGTRGLGRARITPGGWEQRTGMRLRLIYRRSAPSLLVADEARINTRGRAVMNRRRRRRDGIRTGSMTVPIFILVPQVKLRKRLDLQRAAEDWGRRLPGLITGNWPRSER